MLESQASGCDNIAQKKPSTLTSLMISLMGDGISKTIKFDTSLLGGEMPTTPIAFGGKVAQVGRHTQEETLRYLSTQLVSRLPLMRLVQPATVCAPADVSAEAMYKVLRSHKFQNYLTASSIESAGTHTLVGACLYSITSKLPEKVEAKMIDIEDARLEYCAQALTTYPIALLNLLQKQKTDSLFMEIGPIATTAAFTNRKIGIELIRHCVARGYEESCTILYCNSANHFLSLILKAEGFLPCGSSSYPQLSLPDGNRVVIEGVYPHLRIEAFYLTLSTV